MLLALFEQGGQDFKAAHEGGDGQQADQQAPAPMHGLVEKQSQHADEETGRDGDQGAQGVGIIARSEARRAGEQQRDDQDERHEEGGKSGRFAGSEGRHAGSTGMRLSGRFKEPLAYRQFLKKHTLQFSRRVHARLSKYGLSSRSAAVKRNTSAVRERSSV